MKKQTGVYSVEFAIVGVVLFVVLFSILEVGRLFYTWNVLTEASRRGARLAVVCDLDQATMTRRDAMVTAALFDNVQLVPNLSAANLSVQYLQLDGTTAGEFNFTRLVRADIVNYQHDMLIPGLFLTLNSPAFSTTLPRESLGVTRWGFTQC